MHTVSTPAAATTLQEITTLIGEFNKLPKLIQEPTYLEICKYPRSRFEEICSRLLCFYVHPKNEHGLGDLFLSSLLELLSPDKIPFKEEDVKVVCEENAEGKRLDILIYSPTFVIGIENKITAGVYNPLDIYKNRISQYGTDKVYSIILSLKKVNDKRDMAFIDQNGFINITYAELFQKIKKNIGFYMSQANSKYLTYLTDFIQTLENMDGQNIINEKLSGYFYENADKIKNLIFLFGKYKNIVLAQQIQRIDELKEKIIKLTGAPGWWAHEGWDLGYNTFDDSKPKIGVEASYEEGKTSALETFTIYITTWTLDAWPHYEKKVLNKFPGKEPKIDKDRAILIMDTIYDDNEEEILAKLKFYFDFLKELVNKL